MHNKYKFDENKYLKTVILIEIIQLIEFRKIVYRFLFKHTYIFFYS